MADRTGTDTGRLEAARRTASIDALEAECRPDPPAAPERHEASRDQR